MPRVKIARSSAIELRAVERRLRVANRRFQAARCFLTADRSLLSTAYCPLFSVMRSPTPNRVPFRNSLALSFRFPSICNSST
jgi:hypothetical protein